MAPPFKRGAVALAVFLVASVAVIAAWPSIRQSVRPGWRPFTVEIERWSTAYGVSPELVAAVIEAESSGRPRVVSSAGAVGLMQLMPATAAGLAAELGLDDPSREDLFGPDLNVKLGTYYLAKLIKRYDGDTALAVAAYHAGPTNLDRWMATHGTRDARELLGRLDAPRTRAYLERVMIGWEGIAADPHWH